MFGKFTKVSQHFVTLHFCKANKKFSPLLYRYGIRINPIEWYFFLSGKNQAEGHASLFLILCKSFFLFFFFVTKQTCYIITIMLNSICLLYRFRCAHIDMSDDRKRSCFGKYACCCSHSAA